MTKKNLATVLLVALNFTVLLIVGLNIVDLPLLDFQSFRQAQTALSSMTMFRENGFSLVLPVLGNSKIPLEFPIYQYIVYKLTMFTQFFYQESDPRYLIGAIGRIFSSLSMLLTYVAIIQFLKKNNCNAFYALVSIFALSTSKYFINLHFVNLIDCFALLLTTIAYFKILSYIINKNDADFYTAITFIALGMLQKVTTAFPVYLIILASPLICCENIIKKIKYLVPSLVPGIIFAIWTIYSDDVKSENALGLGLTSAALRGWNIGGYNDRISADWYGSVAKFLYPYSFLFALQAMILMRACMIGFKRMPQIEILLLLSSIAWEVIAILLFANLFRHPYYMLSILTPLIVSYAVGLRLFIESKSNIVNRLVAISVLLAFFYNLYFIPSVLRNLDAEVSRLNPILQSANDIAASSNRRIFIAENLDWSSLMPYYSDRQFIMITNIMLNNLKNKGSLEDLLLSLGYDLKDIGGHVYCVEPNDTFKPVYHLKLEVRSVQFNNNFIDCRVGYAE